MSERLTKEDVKAMKYAAENAYFGELYSHEVRHGSGVVDWDLSTVESDDTDADGESIARVYNIRDVRYFVEVTPERVTALLADNERLRARVAELEAPREGILATAQALRLKVNEAAGQEGD